MRNILLIILSLLGASVCLADVELYSFQAYPVVDHARLEWNTGQEGSLRVFVIERSEDGTSFLVVGQVAARGNYSIYRYDDSSPLDADMNRTFYYRLKMVDRDGTTRYSDVREVSLSFSFGEQTWGTIKAMFR